MNLAMYGRCVTAFLALGQRSLVHTNVESAVPLLYTARRMAKALLGTRMGELDGSHAGIIHRCQSILCLTHRLRAAQGVSRLINIVEDIANVAECLLVGW